MGNRLQTGPKYTTQPLGHKLTSRYILKVSNNKIPFGLKNGISVDISKVNSGLACGCVCPSCHIKLQANKGRIVSHYFSHDPSDDTRECKYAFETAIHLMAKQILSEEGRALFPELSIKITQSDAIGNIHEEKSLVEEKTIKRFDLVELEKRLDDIRPDIVAYQNSVPYLIEVAVTHFSDNEKIKLIRSKSIPAIEINLSKVAYTITKEELRLLVIDKVDNRKWLSNPAAVLVKQQLKSKLDKKIRAINENIERAQQKATTHFKANAVLSEKKYFLPNPHSRPISTKQYDPRQFVCEVCKHRFEVPLKDAPYTIYTIQCPECDYAVSAKSD